MYSRSRNVASHPNLYACPNVGCNCSFQNIHGRNRHISTCLHETPDLPVMAQGIDLDDAMDKYRAWRKEDRQLEFTAHKFPFGGRSSALSTNVKPTDVPPAADSPDICFDCNDSAQMPATQSASTPSYVDVSSSPIPSDRMEITIASEQSSSTLNGSFGTNVTQRTQSSPNRYINSDRRIVFDEYTAFQSQLYSEIMQYRGAPLCMYDNILSIIRHWALERNLDFNVNEIYRSRNSLLHRLKKLYKMENFRAKLVNVHVSHDRTLPVVRFDLVEVLCNMFADERIFHPDNIAKGYDIWTGKTEPCDVFGEIHTGDSFSEAVEFYVRKEGDFGIPLVAFYDKTHTDVKGALSTAPFMITLGFLNLATRKKTYVSFPLALIPNLKHGTSSDEQITPVESLQDEHDCLRHALEGLIEIEKKQGTQMIIRQKVVNARPWIHFVIGDIEGNNRLAAHYSDNSGKTARPNRMCKCPTYRTVEPPECTFVEFQEFIEAKKKFKELFVHGTKERAKELMKRISRHPVDTVWEHGVPLSDRKHGINRITPPEVLHVVGTGIAPKLVSSIHGDIKSKTDVSKLDRLHAEIYKDLQRNCDSDYFQSSLTKGSTETTKQGALENIGNLLALTCVCQRLIWAIH